MRGLYFNAALLEATRFEFSFLFPSHLPSISERVCVCAQVSLILTLIQFSFILSTYLLTDRSIG